jgi:hypothetical protein
MKRLLLGFAAGMALTSAATAGAVTYGLFPVHVGDIALWRAGHLECTPSLVRGVGLGFICNRVPPQRPGYITFLGAGASEVSVVKNGKLLFHRQ